MLREAQVMVAVKPHYGYVPDILATCDDPSVLGSDFYVMERLRGTILRRDLPQDLGLDTAAVRKLCTNFIDRLVDLHKVDATTPELAAIGKGEGYVARQVRGWSERWRAATTDGTDACEDVLAWLTDKQPSRETAICVIHNDYRFDNVVLDPNHPLDIVGVLDWEMATLGDPLMDLGGSLAYWVQADDDAMFQSLRRQPTHVPGMLTRRQVVDCYGLNAAGCSVDNFDFYEVFGLFRLMVIIQQIYRRFVLGQTTNTQFAGFGQAATYKGARCRRRIRAVGEQGHGGHLLLIRHGQASFGASDYDRLSAVGEEQSLRLGQWFRQTGQAPDLIATGSMRRHGHTADLCIESAGVSVDRITLAGLDEMDHVEILARHRPDLWSLRVGWLSELVNVPPTGMRMSSACSPLRLHAGPSGRIRLPNTHAAGTAFRAKRARRPAGAGSARSTHDLGVHLGRSDRRHRQRIGRCTCRPDFRARMAAGEYLDHAGSCERRPRASGQLQHMVASGGGGRRTIDHAPLISAAADLRLAVPATHPMSILCASRSVVYLSQNRSPAVITAL